MLPALHSCDRDCCQSSSAPHRLSKELSHHAWWCSICRQIVITTVQTASHPENLSTFAAQDWELLIIDEAHHAPADSYVG
jgi:superfamily II DNA or RNA helicase